LPHQAPLPQPLLIPRPATARQRNAFLGAQTNLRRLFEFSRRRPMTKPKILTPSEIEAQLKGLTDWSVKGSNIEASFAFQTFRDAISFIVQVAIEAEVMNHHPEFYNSYNKVSFSFCTHDVGNKITDADIAIAAKISDAARRFLSMK
jgi:4a-hydroxytetrahydrobiopterin dehydratase